MNIMLTDIRSLSLDMPELAVAAQSTPQEFTGMLQQQLPQVPDGEIQAIDFKGYFENISITDESPGESSGTAPESIWREYLAQHQITVTTESEPLSTAPPIVENIVRQEGQTLPVLSAAGVPVIPHEGEILPVDGNRLPQNMKIGIADEAVLQKVGIAQKTVVTDTATTSAPDMAVPSQTLSVPVSQQASIAISTAKVDPRGVAPAAGAAAIEVAISEPGKEDPLTLKDRLAPTRATQPTMSKPVFETGNDREAGSSRDINPVARIATATERLPVGTDNPVATEVRNMTPGPVQDQSAIRQQPLPEMISVDKTRVATAETVPVMRELSPDKVISGRGNGATAEILQPREPGIAVESRSIEIPSQSSNSQSQGNTLNPVTNTQVAPVAASANAGIPVINTPNPLPAPLETMSLTRNADAGEWSNGLGERVNWMINQKQNTATIRLDPPFLGKLDVQIKVSDDATTITIQTQHAQTRELIDATSARLRDYLQESGYQNVNVDVSQRQEQQQARSQSNAPADSEQADDSAHEQSADSAERETASFFSGDGLVDTFA